MLLAPMDDPLKASPDLECLIDGGRMPFRRTLGPCGSARCHTCGFEDSVMLLPAPRALA